MSLLERIYYFHSRIQNNTFPNASELSGEFEVSLATAHRDISYLRDRLLAPLEFDKQKNGYVYTEAGFRLPFEESSKIVLFLGILTTMASEAGLSELPEFERLKHKLTGMVAPGKKELEQYLHCEWVETEQIDPVIFTTVISALFDQVQVEISYIKGRATTARTVDPLKLIHYQGRWYLYGWCYLRESRRLFHISRIIHAELMEQSVLHAMDEEDASLTGVFGIFKGDAQQEVTIRLTGQAAESIKFQHWHPKQRVEETDHGILLTLPVADDREIIMKVLQFGNMAEITAPPALREKIHTEIQKMLQSYS